MLLAGLTVFGAASLVGGFTTSPGPADRGAGRDGARRRDDLPGHALADHQRLHRAQGTGPRHRPVGRDRRGRDRARADRRRLAARALQLGEHLRRHGPGRGGRHRAGSASASRRSKNPDAARVDIPGLVLSAAAMGLLVFTIIEAPDYGWASGAACSGSRSPRVLLPCSSAGAPHRPPDARRAAVPQHALQRGQRRGHRRVLHAVRVHLPDDAVLPVRPRLQAAVHRRAPAAGGAVGRRRLGGRDAARGAGRHQAHRHRRARRDGGLLRLGRRDHHRDPQLRRSSPSRWCCTGWAWA